MFVNYEILDISPDIPLDILNKSAVAFLPGILYIYVYHIFMYIINTVYANKYFKDTTLYHITPSL